MARPGVFELGWPLWDSHGRFSHLNLANPQEFLEIPGTDNARGDAIVRHRARS